MRSLQIRVVLTFLLTAVFVLTATHALALGLGVVPSSIQLPQALRGSQYVRNFQVLVSGPEASYTLSVEGDAAAWVQVYADAESAEPVTRVTVPADGMVTLTARIAIPDDAPNGAHRATILLQGLASNQAVTENSSGSTVLLQAGVTVSIDVTGTQVLSGEVVDIAIRDTELNSPFFALVVFRNTGNVEARPHVSIDILKGEQSVQTISSQETAIPPGELGKIEIEADLLGVPEGDYLARVNVSLGEQVVAAKDIAFRVVPVGTLTRSGELVSLKTEGEFYAGRVLQVHGTFANTGEVPALAQLLVEIRRDGALVGVEESRQLRVMPHEQEVLKAYVQLTEPGSYVLNCQVDYGGKLTEVRQLSFNVAPPPVEGQAVAAEGASAAVEVPLAGLGGLTLDRQSLPYVAALAALVLMILVLSVSLMSQRRRAAQPVRSHNRSK